MRNYLEDSTMIYKYRAFKIHNAFVVKTRNNNASNTLSIIIQLNLQLSKCGPGKLGRPSHPLRGS